MGGQVIGIATLQAAEGQNLNFAVPAERISQLKVNDVQIVLDAHRRNAKEQTLIGRTTLLARPRAAFA